MTKVLRCSVVVCLFGLLACGDDGASVDGSGSGADGSGANGPGGPGSGGPGSGGPGSGGSQATGSSGQGGFDPGDYEGFGTVGVYSYSHQAAGMPFLASGAFATYAQGGQGPGACTATSQGSCVLYDCPANAPNPSATPVSAGTVTITGGTRTITLSPDAIHVYQPESSQSTALFSGGESISFAVAGAGNIPAHSGQIVAPAPVTVAGINPQVAVIINRSSPLVVNWSGGAGQVLVAAGATVLNGNTVLRSVSLQCRFDAAAGSGSLPAELLGMVPASSASTVGSFSASVIRTSTEPFGDYLVLFQASTLAVTASGEAAAASATFQ